MGLKNSYIREGLSTSFIPSGDCVLLASFGGLVLFKRDLKCLRQLEGVMLSVSSILSPIVHLFHNVPELFRIILFDMTELFSKVISVLFFCYLENIFVFVPAFLKTVERVSVKWASKDIFS